MPGKKSFKIVEFPIPMNLSNRHVHPCQKDVETLFGKGYQLKKLRDLYQPGQYVSQETVILVGPKRNIEKVHLLGPLRDKTQVEISRTDAFALGIEVPLRNSGELKGSAPITIVGPKGKLALKESCILEQRHLHLSLEDAKKLKIKDNQIVALLAGRGKGRETIFFDVICKISEKYRSECHLDLDEGNAALVNNGDSVYLIE